MALAMLPVVCLAAPLLGLVIAAPADAMVAGGDPARVPWGVVGVSVLVSFVAALLATLGGGCVAVVFGLTDLRGARIWMTLLFVPFACPGTVWALAQVLAYGPGGAVEALGGASYGWLANLPAGRYVATTLVSAQIHLPLAALVIARGLRRLPREGWEAACFYLSPLRLAVWLVGAISRELAAAMLMTGFLVLGNFSVPHVVQCRLYSVEIYLRLSSFLDQRGAAWVALPMLFASLIAAMGVTWLLPDASTASRGRPLSLWCWGRWWWIGQLALGCAVVAGEGIPLAALVRECRSWTDWLVTARAAGEESWNSIRIGGVVAGMVVVSTLGLSIAGETARRRASHWGFALTLGVPALLVGLAYSRFFSRLSDGWGPDVRGSGWWLAWGLCFRAWPYASRMVELGWEQMSARWIEAARLANVHSGRQWRWLIAPWLVEHLCAAAVLSFALAVGDVEITQLLCEPGEGTLALRLFTFLHFGPRHTVAGLASLQILISLLPLAFFFARYARSPRVF